MLLPSCRWAGFRLAIIIPALTGLLPVGGCQALVLVEQGQPRATIVVGDEAGASAQSAATALQSNIQQITGATLPIEKAGQFKGDRPVVLVGMSSLAREKGFDVEQEYESGDHYRIKTFNGGVALIGNDAGLRGSSYAVYDFLQRLGCGWYGPDPLWQVIPQTVNLTVPPIDVDERPAFDFRWIWLVKDPVLRDAWRQGGKGIAQGHVLGNLLPREKYVKDHPDYFSKVEGPYQPCLSHPEVIDIISAKLNQQIGPGTGIAQLCIGAIDNDQFCQCDRCTAIGNTSATALHFANEIARKLNKEHRGRFQLNFYAYWVLHDAPNPPIKAEPGVCVTMVNEGNHVQPLDKYESPEIPRKHGRHNTREVNALNGWHATGATMSIYEWWIPGTTNKDWRGMPWYSGDTALANLRYWRERDVRYLTYETQARYEDNKVWPVRWPLFYVGAYGSWNPDVTCAQLMTDACKKLYGPVAGDMFDFYRALELAMADSDQVGGNWHLPSPHLIYTVDVVTRANAALERAEAVNNNATIARRIEAERQMWAEAKQILARLRATSDDRATCSWQIHQKQEDPDRLDLSLHVLNVSDLTLAGTATWYVNEDSLWSVDPGRVEVSLAPGRKKAFRFKAEMAPGPLATPGGLIMPSVEVRLDPPKGESVARQLDLPIDVDAYLKRHRRQTTSVMSKQAPILDGRLDETIWQREPDLRDFLMISMDRKAPVATSAWVTHDQTKLYLAVRCTEPKLDDLETLADHRDDPRCWQDDSIELFVDANLDRSTYYQIIVTAAGITMDGRGMNHLWNGQYEHATGREAHGWTVEMAIPWETLGHNRPTAEGVVGLNLVRNRKAGGSPETFQWQPTQGNNHKPAVFGNLRIINKVKS